MDFVVVVVESKDDCNKDDGTFIAHCNKTLASPQPTSRITSLGCRGIQSIRIGTTSGGVLHSVFRGASIVEVDYMYECIEHFVMQLLRMPDIVPDTTG